MIPARTIARKRDGHELTSREIEEFVDGYLTGDVADYQMSALAMAICLRGMSVAECTTLTRTMLDSGQRLTWPTEITPVDKHSTGGLGDKTSLVLAPLFACCGLQVPMISGRGLGITGGTLDKLESIPGFRTDLTLAEITRQTEQIGCVICGASDELAPLDRRLYALRSVTGTVESIPLITSSILSKKLAESLDCLVLDVKFGSGAFMKTLDAARELAQMLVLVASQLGVRTTAVLSDMNQPLGRMVGNTLEVSESLDLLLGNGPADALHLTRVLAAELMLLARRATDRSTALATIDHTLQAGIARERFVEMVTAQGGRLPTTPAHDETEEICSEQSGYVATIDGVALGLAVIELGGGRKQLGDAIDPRVGLEMLVRIGDPIALGQPLVRVYGPAAKRQTVVGSIRAAVDIARDPATAQPMPLIREIITRERIFAYDELYG